MLTVVVVAAVIVVIVVLISVFVLVGAVDVSAALTVVYSIKCSNSSS